MLEIKAVNVELSADTLRVDQLYRVALLDGRRALFHIEFQGRGSAKPMRWRMLEYMTRIADTEPDLDLLSAVIYRWGAGVRDTGDHQVRAPDGSTSIHWRYRVVRLWEMSAEELLALNRTGLLPLLGQTKLPKPAAVVPEVVEQLQQVDDLELRSRLLASLISLIEDEEIVTMVEQLIEEEGLLLDTPYLSRLRAKAWTEGREE